MASLNKQLRQPARAPSVLQMEQSVRLNPQLPNDRSNQLLALIRQRIVGQDEAVEQLVNLLRVHDSGLSSAGRPVGSMLLLGPTGTGKTRLVEATAEALLGSDRCVIKVDCGEFQHSHEIAKLIGSPPGYLGHRETMPLLSQENLNAHQTMERKISILLFDEIEKGSDALWNLLLGILDKGTLTLGDNRRVDFSRTLIFMTSNLGAAEMGHVLWPKVGFGGFASDPNAALTSNTSARLTKTATEAARRRFSPEFLNRIDKLVVFQPLNNEQLQEVLTLEIQRVRERIFAAGPDNAFGIKVSQDSRSFILEQGTDSRYGARHLKRTLEKLLVQPLANLLATGQIRGGDLIDVDMDDANSSLTFTRRAEGIPVPMIATMFGLKLPAEPQKAFATAAGSFLATKKPIKASRTSSKRGLT
jgi:ATP-dependent Clp protease ATP-binding subunit ClpB